MARRGRRTLGLSGDDDGWLDFAPRMRYLVSYPDVEVGVLRRGDGVRSVVLLGLGTRDTLILLRYPFAS